ncbi:MAG: FAD-dependent oxidoreductase [Oscillospiraceae bacterium]|jgi:thioredoxin reductase (NADPH)|nr:FAD-dependent oxidoreductase [Oscillospiraceae bacterium]
MVAIVGCGPAGISAALYTLRASVETTIIGTRQTALALAEKIENYYGFAEPVSGKELFDNGLRQAERLGCKVVEEEVVSISSCGKQFKIITSSSNGEVEADAVILATGKQRAKVDIKGVLEFEGRGVSYCAICDAFFFRGKSVVVVGDGAYAVAEAGELLNVGCDVTILTNGSESEVIKSSGIKFITKKIEIITGRERVERVVFEGGKEFETAGIFVATGVASSTDLARKLGVLIEGDRILVNENGEANLLGIFAAGDCVNKLCQVSLAVASGTIAGLSAIKYVRALRD